MFILDGSDDNDDIASLGDETEIWRFSPSGNWTLELTEPYSDRGDSDVQEGLIFSYLYV